ncbi:MAG: NAD(P)-dependent oxidoreductase [Bryobacteraceae bacterium]|nr:NAD(P)-dependent oxidoreductase [Bryobacteraceae bacterium]
MRALVTGATGIVGREVTKALLARETPVRVLIRDPKKAWPQPNLETAIGDVRDADAMNRATVGCTHVFHLAAEIHGKNVTSESLFATNLEGTRNIARAALQQGVTRLIYASSVAVYGRSISLHGIDEKTPATPDSPYGASKLAAEESVRSTNGLPFVIVRLANIWGPGAHTWAPLFQKIASGRFRLVGKGTGMHTISSPTDAARGILLCGDTPGIEARTYIMSGKDALPLSALVNLIRDETGGAPLQEPLPSTPLGMYRTLDRIAYRFSRRRLPKADRLDFFLGDRTFDNTAAQRDLGYAPEMTASQIVRATAEWFRAEGLLTNRS